MKTGMGKAGLCLLVSIGMLNGSFAGSLGDFEDAVAKPVEHSPSRHHHHDDEDDGLLDDLFGDCLTIGVVAGAAASYRGVKWLVYDWWAGLDDDLDGDGESFVVEAPEESISPDPIDMDETFDDLDVPSDFKHKIGSPGLPYARFDYRWQYLDHDTDANDFLLEAGYKAVAAYGRVTQYHGAAAEDLDIEQYYGMVRFGGNNDFFFSEYGSFQIGAGIGWYTIRGDQTQDGPAMTIPIVLHPSDWVGVEFRPAWSVVNDKTIGDYDLSVTLGHQFTHLNLGYRWLWVQHEGHWLNGPHAGISVAF